MSNSMYDSGGIPQKAGKVLFPTAISEGETTEVYGGEQKIATTSQGPATFSGSDNSGDFLSKAGYDTGSM
jgi:hypothetical protein